MPTEHAPLSSHYVAPRASEIRQVALTSMNISANSDRVIVRALWSGISRGTEKLVFEGRVPESEFERMRAPFQDGSFPYPVKYGYSVAGVVEEGSPDLIGKDGFRFTSASDTFLHARNAVMPLLTACRHAAPFFRPTWRRLTRLGRRSGSRG